MTRFKFSTIAPDRIFLRFQIKKNEEAAEEEDTLGAKMVAFLAGGSGDSLTDAKATTVTADQLVAHIVAKLIDAPPPPSALALSTLARELFRLQPAKFAGVLEKLRAAKVVDEERRAHFLRLVAAAQQNRIAQ